MCGGWWCWGVYLFLHELTANEQLGRLACPGFNVPLSHCVSLQPTCLPGRGEPPSVPLSGPRHSSTRISATLRLCRRLLSGQYGSHMVWRWGQGVPVPFRAPAAEVGGGGGICQCVGFIATSLQVLLLRASTDIFTAMFTVKTTRHLEK